MAAGAVGSDGGHILCGGAAGDGSWIVRPTVVVEAPLTSRLYREGGDFSREFCTEAKAIVMEL